MFSRIWWVTKRWYQISKPSSLNSLHRTSRHCGLSIASDPSLLAFQGDLGTHIESSRISLSASGKRRKQSGINNARLRWFVKPCWPCELGRCWYRIRSSKRAVAFLVFPWLHDWAFYRGARRCREDIGIP